MKFIDKFLIGECVYASLLIFTVFMSKLMLFLTKPQFSIFIIIVIIIQIIWSSWAFGLLIEIIKESAKNGIKTKV